MDVAHEINELKRRVSDLEGAFGILTNQLRSVHPAVVTLREDMLGRLDRFDAVLERVDKRLDGFGVRINGMELQVWSLRDDLPDLIAGAIKSVGREPP
jgi:hypothetical protein